MKNIESKLLKHYIGYIGERDEYQKSKIYELLAGANILTFWLINILMLLSLFWDIAHRTLSFGTICLLIVQQFNSFYIVIKMRKNSLEKTEYYDLVSLNLARKNVKRKSIFAAIQWTFLMFVLMELVFPTIGGEPISIDLISLIGLVIAGLLFGIGIYFFTRSQLKLVKDDGE